MQKFLATSFALSLVALVKFSPSNKTLLIVLPKHTYGGTLFQSVLLEVRREVDEKGEMNNKRTREYGLGIVDC